MEKVIATTGLRVRGMVGGSLVAFVGLAVWGWFAIAREQAPPLALALYGVGLAALLVVSAVTAVTYVADDVGLERRGLFGKTSLRWRDVGRCRIVVRQHRALTCILYDVTGERRIAVRFALLEQNGEALRKLLTRKLAETLPDQAEQWAPLAQADTPSGNARRSRAVLPTLLVSASLLAVASYLTITCGPRAWQDCQLLRHGRTATATVWAVLEDGSDLGAMYQFASAAGKPVTGAVWTRREDYARYVQRQEVRVRYLPADPRRNAPQQLVREQWPLDLAATAGILACVLGAFTLLARLARSGRRPRDTGAPTSP